MDVLHVMRADIGYGLGYITGMARSGRKIRRRKPDVLTDDSDELLHAARILDLFRVFAVPA